MMDGRVRAGRRVRQGWKRVDGKCQGKAEGGDEWCVTKRRAEQGMAGQGRAEQSRTEKSRAEQSSKGKGKGGEGRRGGGVR